MWVLIRQAAHALTGTPCISFQRPFSDEVEPMVHLTHCLWRSGGNKVTLPIKDAAIAAVNCGDRKELFAFQRPDATAAT